MKIVSSYKVGIKGVDNQFNNIFKETVKIFRKAVKFYIHLIEDEWDTFNTLSGNECILPAEELSHITKSHPNPKYNFDTEFYKVPCYFRRNAIIKAFGIVSSYKSNYAKWEINKQGKEPKLQYNHQCMPTFYYSNMYVGDCYSASGKIKVFDGNDWVWKNINFKSQDLKYLNKYWSGIKAKAPVLEYSYGKYSLRFAFEEKTNLNQTDIENQLILSVDLGINTDATCSVMDAKGTVYKRIFINATYEKDLLQHRINRTKKYQRIHGSKNVQSQWSHINNLNKQISCIVAKRIVETAVLYNVDAIVFEYLNITGKRTQRIHLWRKKEIQNIAEHQAHRNGIHVYRINPKNTSALAFDGSGAVERDSHNYSICTFKNKKVYNCDLSASYNIGARYFIREILKPLPATVVSDIGAKVPDILHRTKTTLSTLISLRGVLSSLTA